MTSKFHKTNQIIAGLSSFLVFCVFCSCNDDGLTIGENFVESQTHILVIDTFTVKSSTVLLESLPTSGDSLLMVGRYSDDILGKIESKSFFQIGLSSGDFDIVKDDVFDSITLYLSYSGYSYGDTNKVFGFSLHKLLAQPEADDYGYLYNNSTVAYSPEIFASFTGQTHPSRKDTLEIRLPDDFGKALFDSILVNSEISSNESKFLEYFKGFALVSDSLNANCIVGFSAKAATLKMRIYYHRYGEIREKLTSELPITNIDLQFNQITHDFKGTTLEGLAEQKSARSSTLTDNNSFLLGGVGLMPKVQFSCLQELMYYNRGAILKAELIVKPDKESYSFFDLPSSLFLYSVNKYNKTVGTLADTDGNVIYASFTLDNMYHENTSYTFDISNYIINELSDGIYDPENGLFISTSSAQYSNLITRLILECKDPAPKLKIYYATY